MSPLRVFLSIYHSLTASSSGSTRCKIFVGNIHKDTTPDELRALFSPHGTVVEADIIANYAFVVSGGEGSGGAAWELADII